jgi:NTE family protein
MATLRVAVGCQGGGSHTAFTAGALRRMLRCDVDVVALSGTSGGAVCALLAWYGLLQHDRGLAARLLARFWEDMSVRDGWERLMHDWYLSSYRLLGMVASPEQNPYQYPYARWGQLWLRQAVEKHVDFEKAAGLVTSSSPLLAVSAVDVLSGEFRVFKNGEVTPEAILASAAVPTLFPAVPLGDGLYWDGLFSQNPPIRDLLSTRPDELWIIQVNRKARSAEPRSLSSIRDRRNELSANLSLEQELHPIATINALLAQGQLADSGFRHITVRRIELLQEHDSASKLDRSPAFIKGLLEHGEDQADRLARSLGL